MIYEGEGGLAYVVKDFGDIRMATDDGIKYEPLRKAIRHMIQRGYGVRDGKIPDQSDAIERLIDRRIGRNLNLWMNIFLFTSVPLDLLTQDSGKSV